MLKIKNLPGVAAVLLVILGITLVSSVNAGCLDDSQNGGASTTIKWEPAVEREDGEVFPDDDNAGYSVHYTDTTDNTKCERRVPNKLDRTADFNIHFNRQYNFSMRQWDTGDRVSQHSSIKSVMIEKEVIPIGQPGAVTDATYTRINDSFNWQLSFSEVTTYDDGTPLPEGAVRKYYLFDTFKITDSNTKGWVKDIYYATIPLTINLEEGYHSLTLETEISIDGALAVSKRSPVVNIDSQVVIPPPVEPKPPMPPVIIEIPPGATEVEVTFN